MAVTRVQLVGNVSTGASFAGIVTASGGFNLGISSAGSTITSGPVKTLNFVGTGNTFAVTGTTVDISISGGGGSGGLGTALSSDQNSALNKIYYVDKVLGVTTTITVDPPSTSMVAFTQYPEIRVDTGADFIVADGDDFIPNILGIGTTGTLPALGGSGGRVRADNFANNAGTGAPTFTAGLNVTGVVTATTFSGNATTATTATTANALATNATGTNLTLSGNLTVNGTQTTINTQILDVADKTIGIGSTSSPSDVLSDGAGIAIYGTTNKTWNWERGSGSFVYSEPNKFKGVVETVSTATTYNTAGGALVVEMDVRNATTYTYTIPTGVNIGIVSFKNMPAFTGNSNGTTVTLITTQNTAGTGNTTAATGIGTNITVVGYQNGATVAGISTRALVGSATTITLSTTGSDRDFISFFIHYTGGTNTTASSYQVYATKNGGFRQGNIGV